MMLLGVSTQESWTAVGASVQLRNGITEKDVLGIVGPDVFETVALALESAAIVKASELQIFTNDIRLVKFLTPPISVKPTSKVFVKGWGMVPVGGDPNQWAIVRGLFQFNRWSIKQVAKLPNTEALYAEYIQTDYYQTAIKRGLRGCGQRLHQGVWTSTQNA
jgi:hypothetical protein